jgi:hypothetical protein
LQEFFPLIYTQYNSSGHFRLFEGRLIRLKFFSNDAFEEMKAFEKKIKKNRMPVKIADNKIVDIIKSIRKRRNASV